MRLFPSIAGCKSIVVNNQTTNSRCDFCEKTAVGLQILGCISQNVCEDHAEDMLVAIKPGEQKDWGVCYFIRYAE